MSPPAFYLGRRLMWPVFVEVHIHGGPRDTKEDHGYLDRTRAKMIEQDGRKQHACVNNREKKTDRQRGGVGSVVPSKCEIAKENGKKKKKKHKRK